MDHGRSEHDLFVLNGSLLAVGGYEDYENGRTETNDQASARQNYTDEEKRREEKNKKQQIS